MATRSQHLSTQDHEIELDALRITLAELLLEHDLVDCTRTELQIMIAVLGGLADRERACRPRLSVVRA